MNPEFEPAVAKATRNLELHPIYAQVNSLPRLRLFMQRHVFAVLDFMSLTKRLQAVLAPVDLLWVPPRNPDLARFINEVVLSEESDRLPDGSYLSHFEMYLQSMQEIQADTNCVHDFVQSLKRENLNTAFKMSRLPESARQFMLHTFSLVTEGKIHEVAGAFCYGREKCIPKMFQAFINDSEVTKAQAPMFHYYLERHIEVDAESHGPMALKMLEILCGEDAQKWQEAQRAALAALERRSLFWDSVLSEIEREESFHVSTPVR